MEAVAAASHKAAHFSSQEYLPRKDHISHYFLLRGVGGKNRGNKAPSLSLTIKERARSYPREEDSGAHSASCTAVVVCEMEISPLSVRLHHFLLQSFLSSSSSFCAQPTARTQKRKTRFSAPPLSPSSSSCAPVRPKEFAVCACAVRMEEGRGGEALPPSQKTELTLRKYGFLQL